MTAIPTRRLMPRAQVLFRTTFTALMQRAAEQIIAILISASGADGVIDRREAESAVRRAGSIVSRVFTGVEGRTVSEDGTPHAPYALLLMSAIAWLTAETAGAHARFMADALPQDVLAWLQSAPVSQLAGYTRAQAWVDENGLTLAERIQRAEADTRTRAQALIRDEIIAGTAAVLIGRKLAQWLIPGRAKLRRTNKRYGTDGSYAAMRIARTEIVRAGSEAALVSARTNPLTRVIDIVRSPAGDPDCPICAEHESINVAGERVREPYRIGEAPLPGFHPNCMCSVVTRTIDAASAAASLRERIRRGERPPVTPVSAGFARALLGT